MERRKATLNWLVAQVDILLADRDGGWKICPRRECRRRQGCALPRGICEWPRPPLQLTPEEQERREQRGMQIFQRALAQARANAAGAGQEEPKAAELVPRRRSGPAKR